MFDPFDEKHRDKRKRRKPNEVEFDNQQRQERLDKHFKRAMKDFGWPNYVQSNSILNAMAFSEERNLSERLLRYNFESAMNRLGWVKVPNPKSKDGRWSACGENFFVYSKRGMEKVEKSELKQVLGW
jgi:hypothetical protein